MAQRLHNGLECSEESLSEECAVSCTKPMPVPYLDNRPAVIPINTGRQLFVDEFLIDETTLSRRFHQARKHGPAVTPPVSKDSEGNEQPFRSPKSGGVWWDTKDQLYKMWKGSALDYLVSHDGVEWNDPGLVGTIGDSQSPPWKGTASDTVLIDEDDAPSRRYKCYVRLGIKTLEKFYPELVIPECYPDGGWRGRQVGFVLTSPDGVHWSEPLPTTPVGDRSTMFYDPFRKKWVSSIRHYTGKPMRRIRHYFSSDNFLTVQWAENEECFWMKADELDLPDPEIGDDPQLYNVDAVAYESLMLGSFMILHGPHNDICAQGGYPKTSDLKLGFSRDGIYWDRPCRDAFIPSSRKPDTWDRGYVQSIGGLCTVSDDELRFYYSGMMGDTSNKGESEAAGSGMYSNQGVGFATLRRDGFASMESTADAGTLTTRPLSFDGRFLFVNVDAPDGALTAELLDEAGAVIAPFAAARCRPVSTDSTCVQVEWEGGDDLSAHQGKPMRFRFNLTSGRLYAFWISPDKSGVSRGYLAAGCKNKNAYVDGRVR